METVCSVRTYSYASGPSSSISSQENCIATARESSSAVTPLTCWRSCWSGPGELVTREELRKRLWPEDTFVDFEQILNNSVRMLREALGDKAEAPQFIETLPRLGYRFIAPVDTNAMNHAPASSLTAGPESSDEFCR